MSIHPTIAQWLTDIHGTHAPEGRPFVTVSYAQSLDGSIALRDDEPLVLSGQQSLRLTHQLRSLHDGILVGIGTVLSDDPQLTVRHWPGNNPQPIVLDSQCRIPPAARLCHGSDKTCWVLTTRTEGWRAFEGVEICPMAPDAEGRVNLRQALSFLHEKGIRRVMVEGGAKVITAFIKARLVDALVLTITPNMIGGYRGVHDLALTSRADFPRLATMHCERLEQDLILWGQLQFGEDAT